MAIGKISDFKAALTLGGARPSLFDVKINGPVATVPNIEALAKSQYQCSYYFNSWLNCYTNGKTILWSNS